MSKTLLWFVILHDLVLTVLWFMGEKLAPVFIGGWVFFIILLLIEYKLIGTGGDGTME